MASSLTHRVVVLYGVGGLSDVGRHAVEAALELQNSIESVTVLTRYPDLLNEPNWKCGCENHPLFSDPQKNKRVKIDKVESWKNDDITNYFEDTTAVVSCLGHRQPMMWGYCEANDGNDAVIRAIQNAKNGPKRVVVCSSVGIEEDWPPMEFFTPGKYILGGLFMSFAYPAFRDLTKMERQYKSTTDDSIDYLFVRPVGIGEDVIPQNKWILQKEKYKDNAFNFNMAKLDVARYMIQEAIKPTRHRTAVVIGGIEVDENKTNNEENSNTKADE